MIIKYTKYKQRIYTIQYTTYNTHYKQHTTNTTHKIPYTARTIYHILNTSQILFVLPKCKENIKQPGKRMQAIINPSNYFLLISGTKK